MISEGYCSRVQRSALVFQTLPEERSRVKPTKLDPSPGTDELDEVFISCGTVVGPVGLRYQPDTSGGGHISICSAPGSARSCTLI